MRTLPANFTLGLTNHFRMVWLVKLIGSTATYYWLTNKTGRTATSNVVLTESSVTKTYDSSLLAKTIDNSPVVPIGEIENNIDVSMGGAVASCSDVDLILLNQLRLDTTLAGYELENRPVSIYCGFIPDGATPTLEITDMICLWTGIFGSHEEDYSSCNCSLLDARDLRHKTIPQTVIDTDVYPSAPEESIGQVLPILYGDFTLTDTNSTNKYYELYNLCPAICTNRFANNYCIAGHITHTAGTVFYHNGSMKTPAFVEVFGGGSTFTAPTINANSSGLSTIAFPIGQITGKCYQLFSYAGAGNVVANPERAIDGDPATYAEITDSQGQRLEMCIEGLPNENGIKDYYADIYFITDGIGYVHLWKAGRIDRDEVEENEDIPEEAAGVFSIGLYADFQSCSNLGDNRWYIKHGDEWTTWGESVRIYAMGLYYRFVIAGNVNASAEWDRRRDTGHRRGLR